MTDHQPCGSLPCALLQPADSGFNSHLRLRSHHRGAESSAPTPLLAVEAECDVHVSLLHGVAAYRKLHGKVEALLGAINVDNLLDFQVSERSLLFCPLYGRSDTVMTP